MNWVAIICWRRTHDPHGFLSDVQRMIIDSALMRDDVKTAKQHLIDWKIPS